MLSIDIKESNHISQLGWSEAMYVNFSRDEAFLFLC